MSATNDPQAAVPFIDPAEVVDLSDELLASIDMGDDPDAPPTNEDEIEEA
jgi:hypothetical protein